MDHRTRAGSGFKRQVVVRLDVDEWPLLEAAVAEHGSIQKAVLSGLRALADKRERSTPPDADAHQRSVRVAPSSRGDGRKIDRWDPDDEILAGDAAQLLDLKTETVRGYLRSGRLPGRYEDDSGRRGWITTRGAVEAYRNARTLSP